MNPKLTLPDLLEALMLLDIKAALDSVAPAVQKAQPNTQFASNAPSTTRASTHAQPAPHPFVGQYVVCRCYSAGVHAGVLVSMDGGNVILADSRRLWAWKAKSGVALSGLAQNGLATDGQKFDTSNPKIALTDVIECIPAAPGVDQQIRNV